MTLDNAPGLSHPLGATVGALGVNFSVFSKNAERLAGTKLIAEAWDAGGLYQVGSFIGDSWKEWNGCFRDDVRAFFRGEPGSVGQFASRLLGSPDIYAHEEREIECLLGAFGLRTSTAIRSGRNPLAPLDRHLTGFTRRHRRIYRSASNRESQLQGGGSLGGLTVCADGESRCID